MTLNECLGIGNGRTLENWTYWRHVPAVVAGTCHHRSLTDDTKHQVALNTYELDVFSIAGLGGLCPPSQKPGGLGGSAPQPKIFKNKEFLKFFSRDSFSGTHSEPTEECFENALALDPRLANAWSRLGKFGGGRLHRESSFFYGQTP